MVDSNRNTLHRRFVAGVILAAITVALPAGRVGGIVPPRHGGSLPSAVIEEQKRTKNAFLPKRAWIPRRDRQLGGGIAFRPMPSYLEGALQAPHLALSGTLRVPVLLGIYSDIPEIPVQDTTLQRLFFDGPWPTGTISDYYREVSLGLFDVRGNVRDWVVLSGAEAYYTGGQGGLNTYVSRTGEMITELLDANDAALDFGQYDNDGPDGMPNSGDDDGFVDYLVIVHPTIGAECNSNLIHMWSHSGLYSIWPASGGQPYATNDPAAGGGTILVDDYMIGPALSCDTGVIEIGVFCHEIGHGLGLVDLYDSYGGAGIGYWGLMGAGNWNTPASPAHPCAWSREQLGWIDPVEIDWRQQSLALDPVATSGDAVKLVLPSRRFRHMRYFVGDGGLGLVCGYTYEEALARAWYGVAGYGNEWNESMVREFHFDGTYPVSLEYEVFYDLELFYDFGYALLERSGSIDTLAVYNGSFGERPTIDLSPYLPPVECDFSIRFHFRSDVSYSDEDGGFPSHEGYCFTIDNVIIEGGGIDYACDFEADAGGWREDAEPAEYFLVENRRRIGFDSNLPGQGLLIWHAENSIAYSYLGNTGGPSNTAARGVVLEEADGLYNLLKPSSEGGNYGDQGDPFPGSTGNRIFASSSSPDSRSNGGFSTPISITGITSSASAVSAVFVGGMYAPEILSFQPDSVDVLTQDSVTFDISGTGFQYGAGCYLAFGTDTVRAFWVDWLGEERVIARFETNELYSGLWDLVVVSGDGQEAAAEAGVRVSSVFESHEVSTGRDYVELRWSLSDMPGIRGCMIFRSEDGGTFEQLTDTLHSGTGSFAYRDYTVAPEIGYSYMIIAYIDGIDEQILVLNGPFAIDDVPFVADPIFPNPFSDGTIIGFFTPSSRIVSIRIYDVAGRLVADLGKREYTRGTHRQAWAPPRDLASGIYFCLFESGSTKKSVKMVLIR
jgi:M6 family metalloprotease-like protein